jgi:hypothetical protein
LVSSEEKEIDDNSEKQLEKIFKVTGDNREYGQTTNEIRKAIHGINKKLSKQIRKMNGTEILI